MNIFATRAKFNEACQANETRIGEIHGAHQLNPELPERFHHYTNIEGLYGILKSGDVWATGVEYLNDMVEISYGVELAKEVVNQQIEESSGAGNLVVRLRLYHIRHELERNRANTSYFITCFCEESDLLSQWRAYGKNAGYSLDLHAKTFYQSISSFNDSVSHGVNPRPTRPVYMEKVIYDPAVQKSLMSRVVESCVQAYRDLIGDEDFLSEEQKMPQDPDFVELVNRFSTYAAGKALRFVSQFKHPAFEEEKEWRLVHRRDASDRDGMEFRPSNGYLIPYVRFKCDFNKCLKSITCGPMSSTLSMKSIKTFINTTAINDIPILATNAPLRF